MSGEPTPPEGTNEAASERTNPLGVDPKLLDILVCPLTKSTLTLDREKGWLVSRKAGLAYPIRDGVPILLESEAIPIEE